MTDLPPEVELLALAAIENELNNRQAVVKALVGQRYGDGDKRTFRSPLTGAKLGQVWRTDPDPKMVITDRAELEEHLRSFPGNLIKIWEITDLDAAIGVLHDVAPHLLAEVTRLDPTAVDAALAQSRVTGAPAAPGIELRKPGGVFTPKPDAGAYEQVARLVLAGVLTWDARPVLPAAEAAS